MRELLFATGNQAKLSQLRFVAERLSKPVTVVSGRERYGDKARYEEEGETVAEIALRGALDVARRLGVPVLTEDTGFFVDGLGGEPGLRAGRFLVERGRSAILELLREIDGSPAASIVSAACYATPEGVGAVFENVVRGHVVDEEQWEDYPDWVAPQAPGDLGGGYNSIFVPAGYDRTLAQISPEEALEWSYRERNFRQVLDIVADDDALAALPPLVTA